MFSYLLLFFVDVRGLKDPHQIEHLQDQAQIMLAQHIRVQQSQHQTRYVHCGLSRCNKVNGKPCRLVRSFLLIGALQARSTSNHVHPLLAICISRTSKSTVHHVRLVKVIRVQLSQHRTLFILVYHLLTIQLIVACWLVNVKQVSVFTFKVKKSKLLLTYLLEYISVSIKSGKCSMRYTAKTKKI